MKKELRVLFFGIIGSILVSGGTIAIAIGAQVNQLSYYPILVFLGGIMLIYAIFASLIYEPAPRKSQ
jgi:hypothetical protein